MATVTDIIQEARDLVDADSTSYPAATILRRLNAAYEKVVGWLINADGLWQFDDTNFTDFPIGTFTLVNSQERYSFNDKFLQLEEVSVKNQNGVFQILKTIDQKEYSTLTPLAEAFKTDGLPTHYDKVSDDTIDLFPAPDNGVSVTLAAGLKIKFKRTAQLYTSAEVTTGTKQPGFASTHHYILSYMIARPYALSYKKDRWAEINAIIGDTTLIPTGMKAELLKDYGRRSKDERKIMTMKPILNR